MGRLFPGENLRTKALLVVLLLCLTMMPADIDENIFGAVCVWRWSLFGLSLAFLSFLAGSVRPESSLILELVSDCTAICADISVFGITATCALSLASISESWLPWLVLFVVFLKLSVSSFRRIMIRRRKIVNLIRLLAKHR